MSFNRSTDGFSGPLRQHDFFGLAAYQLCTGLAKHFATHKGISIGDRSRICHGFASRGGKSQRIFVVAGDDGIVCCGLLKDRRRRRIDTASRQQRSRESTAQSGSKHAASLNSHDLFLTYRTLHRSTSRKAAGSSCMQLIIEQASSMPAMRKRS